MKATLLKLLVCPACGAGLACETWKAVDAEVEEGLLTCPCDEAYPVIGAVPRMLLGPFRAQLGRTYPDYFARYRSQLPTRLLPGAGTASDGTAAAAVQTQQSFGFEWTKFAGMRPEWERNYWGYLAPKSAEFLRGKVVLDAGCGMGRHLHYTARHGAEAVGVDFSGAVDVARQNTSGLPNAHVVQADLYALPFRPEAFDFIYSLGVLHHLPAPEDAFQRLLVRLKPGGEIRIYLYWSLEGSPGWKRALLGCATGMRRVTTRLPHRLLLGACYPVAAALWFFFVLPYRFLSRAGWAETLPLKQYAAYPFGVLLNDTFDRLSAPIENRYTPAEVRSWFEKAGLTDVEVLPYAGWLGHGCKPPAAGAGGSTPSGTGQTGVIPLDAPASSNLHAS